MSSKNFNILSILAWETCEDDIMSNAIWIVVPFFPHVFLLNLLETYVMSFFCTTLEELWFEHSFPYLYTISIQFFDTCERKKNFSPFWGALMNELSVCPAWHKWPYNHAFEWKGCPTNSLQLFFSPQSATQHVCEVIQL